MKTKIHRSTSNNPDHAPLGLNLDLNRNPQPPLPRGEGWGEGQTSTSVAQVLSLPLDFNRKSKIRNRKSLSQQLTRSRAAWWFRQMRKAVDAAPDWKPIFSH